MTRSFTLTKLRLLFLLLLPLPLFAQTGAVTGVALDNVGNVVAGATISVCAQGSPGIPCTPVVASGVSNGQGIFAVTVPIGTYTVTVFRLGVVATSSTVVVAPSNITVANNVTYSGTVVFSGNVTFTNQITSTLPTGTAPFSIASTTVVPNLNAQLHNGLTAPASAIVGISDSQILTNKTMDCTANTLAKNPCVVYSTASASTNASISATTMATAGGGGNAYRATFYLDETVAGASCASNTTVAVILIFTDPNASSTTTSTVTTMTIVNNGTVGTTNTLFNSSGIFTAGAMFRAKASTNVQYSVTYTIGGSCSPGPSYQVYPILELLQ